MGIRFVACIAVVLALAKPSVLEASDGLAAKGLDQAVVDSARWAAGAARKSEPPIRRNYASLPEHVQVKLWWCAGTTQQFSLTVQPHKSLHVLAG